MQHSFISDTCVCVCVKFTWKSNKKVEKLFQSNRVTSYSTIQDRYIHMYMCERRKFLSLLLLSWWITPKTQMRVKNFHRKCVKTFIVCLKANILRQLNAEAQQIKCIRKGCVFCNVITYTLLRSYCSISLIFMCLMSPFYRSLKVIKFLQAMKGTLYVAFAVIFSFQMDRWFSFVLRCGVSEKFCQNCTWAVVREWQVRQNVMSSFNMNMSVHCTQRNQDQKVLNNIVSQCISFHL